MIIAGVKDLRVRLDDTVISIETAAHVDALLDDLIGAAIAQEAYQKALQALGDRPEPRSGPLDYAARTPHVFAQAWVRILRDFARELTFLADEPTSARGACAAAAAFETAFPGIAAKTGAMRVSTVGPELAYFAAGSGFYPVKIDAAAVDELEAIARTLLDALPKAKTFDPVR